MPILRRRADGGLILRGFVRSAHGFCTWQLSDEGVRHLHAEGVMPGDRLQHAVFQFLVERGYAYTGKSGVTESAITPELLEEPTRVTHRQSEANKPDANAEKLLARWLPRLADRAPEVRQQAALHLGKLAVRSPEYRGRLVTLLLDFAVEEEYWFVVLNGLLFHGEFASVPKLDAQWLVPFIEAYLEIGMIPGAKQSGGWRELERLIQEGHLTPRNPEFTRVIDSASQALGGADDDARAHIFSIVDWAEDNA